MKVKNTCITCINYNSPTLYNECKQSLKKEIGKMKGRKCGEKICLKKLERASHHCNHSAVYGIYKTVVILCIKVKQKTMNHLF